MSDSEEELIAAQKPHKPDVEIVEGDLVDESDEDSAPEDVSFGASKATALRKIKDTIELIQGERQKRKEKRKQQDEKFKHQKKLKSEALAKSRLPDDFLENLPSKPVVVQTPITEHLPHDISDGGQNSEGENFPVESDGDEEEFIALNKNVNAVFIRDHIKKRLETVESLTDFRNKLLYGNRIQRETVKSRLSKAKKRVQRLL